jgi:hypothetical protein
MIAEDILKIQQILDGFSFRSHLTLFSGQSRIYSEQVICKK